MICYFEKQCFCAELKHSGKNIEARRVVLGLHKNHLCFKAKKLDCCEVEAKNFCNISEKINNLFLKISSVLYLFSITTFTISQIV